MVILLIIDFFFLIEMRFVFSIFDVKKKKKKEVWSQIEAV